jgi:hydrogenase nickel incorporation protein HypB
MAVRVSVVEQILNANDQLADANRARLDAAGVFALNVMASPGAGKTSLIMRTVEALRGEFRIGAVDGDIATTIDADRIAALGVPAVQINTGGACHLDAAMLQRALPELPLEALDLLIVENVGNLVCPASFKLGVHRSILIASVPEGDDKPYKYPVMYRGVDGLVLNKMDVLAAFDFDVDYFRRGVEALNPGLAFFPLSCKTGEGLEAWLTWLREWSSATLWGDERAQAPQAHRLPGRRVII